MVAGFALVGVILIATIHWDSTQRHKDNLAAEQAAAEGRVGGSSEHAEAAKSRRQGSPLSFAGEVESAVSDGGQAGSGATIDYAPTYATTRPVQGFADPDGPPVDLRQLPRMPGETVTIRGVPSDQSPGKDRSKKNRIQRGPVSSAETAAIKAVSRQRSGASAGQND